MINPLNHEKISTDRWRGLGDNPESVLAAYVYYVEALIEPSLTSIDQTLSVHDRLLEATLVIFDAMASDKAALDIIYPELRQSPCVLKSLRRVVHGFFHRMFVRLGLRDRKADTVEHLSSMAYSAMNVNKEPFSGLLNEARLYVYIDHYVRWVRVWLSDDTADQHITLATIDQDLVAAKEWKDWIAEKVGFASI